MPKEDANGDLHSEENGRFVPKNKGAEVKEVLDKIGLNGSNMNRHAVFKKTSKLPTMILPEDEYAHVMSEIATNMSVHKATQPIVHEEIGNCRYIFENRGFGNYRIIYMEPIEDYGGGLGYEYFRKKGI